MANNQAPAFALVQDDPYTFLDARRNPVYGRKLTYRLADGTTIELDVNMADYHDADTIKTKIRAEADAHNALLG